MIKKLVVISGFELGKSSSAQKSEMKLMGNPGVNGPRGKL